MSHIVLNFCQNLNIRKIQKPLNGTRHMHIIKYIAIVVGYTASKHINKRCQDQKI